MALVACPECGGRISTEAKACPHCGYWAAAVAKPQPGKPVAKTAPPMKRPEGVAWVSVLAVGGGIVVALFVAHESANTADAGMREMGVWLYVCAVASVVQGIGWWQGRAWAWWLTQVALFLNGADLIAQGRAMSIRGAILVLFWWYTLRPATRAWFKKRPDSKGGVRAAPKSPAQTEGQRSRTGSPRRAEADRLAPAETTGLLLIYLVIAAMLVWAVLGNLAAGK